MTNCSSWKDLILERSPVRVVTIVNHTQCAAAAWEGPDIQKQVLEKLECNVEDARTLILVKYPHLTTMVFDVFHDSYNFMTADKPEDLPVLIVRIFRANVVMMVASGEKRREVNQEIAEYHELNGFVEPPFLEDHCDGNEPVYLNPRRVLTRGD